MNFHKNYQVSNLGNVRNGKTFHPLKQHDSNGYKRLKIGHQNFKVHRLVAQMFLTNHKNLPLVNHENGNKTENHVDNLKWCDHKDNTKHAFDIGLAKSGEHNRNAKLTNQIVADLKANYHKPDRQTVNEISAKLGVHWTTIRDLFSGKTWKRINPAKNE